VEVIDAGSPLDDARHSKAARPGALPFRRFASRHKRAIAKRWMVPILPAPTPARYEAIVQNGSYR
jgi:hypothetical protein